MNDLRVLVTGGAGGIGWATAQAFLARGAHVAILDRQIVQSSSMVSVVADLADGHAIETAVGSVISQLGGLDVLVNNAGVGAEGEIQDNSDDEWRAVLDINVIGVARVTRSALGALRNSDHAAIVNVSSAVATVGLPRRTLYSASKGAIASMTRAMAVDLLPHGIRVNAVSPGTTDTPWVGRLLINSSDPQSERAALSARQPHGRLVSPDEIAAAILYLASPQAGSTTGADIAVDGGLTMLRRTQPTEIS